MEESVFSKSSCNNPRKPFESSKKKWVNTYSKQIYDSSSSKNKEFEGSREDLSLTFQEKNEREARALAFLKELSEREDLTNTSIEEKFNDFGISQGTSKLIRRPKKSRENTSCPKSYSRQPVIHNRLENYKREEILHVSSFRATNENFAPYHQKKVIKGSNNELLERSYTDKERLEEYINLETNEAHETQKDELKGSQEAKSELLKGEKETKYHSILTTSVKALRKRLSRQFLKSKSKVSLLERKALNVSDLKGGEIVKKVEQHVLGKVILHGKSLGVSKIDKSKSYPYKSTLQFPETNETKEEEINAKKDIDQEQRLFTGEGLYQSIVIKKVDGFKQGLQDILQTASIVKNSAGLRTSVNNYENENASEKDIFDSTTMKFWKEIENLSSRSKSRKGKKESNLKVQEKESKEQEKLKEKDDPPMNKVEELFGLNSAINHRYLRKIAMKKLGTDVSGKSVLPLKVTKEKNKESKENLLKENLEELYCKLSQREGNCLNSLNFGNYSEISTAPTNKTEPGSKLPIIHSLKFQESSLAKFVIKNSENRSKSIGSVTHRPLGNEHPVTMNVSKEFNDFKLVGNQLCQPVTQREMLPNRKKTKKKSVINHKIPVQREGYSVYPVRELINQDSELCGSKSGPTLAPLYSWDVLSIRGSI